MCRNVALQFAQLQILLVALFIVKHVAGGVEVVVEFHAHIAAAVLGEGHVAVAIDVLRIEVPASR